MIAATIQRTRQDTTGHPDPLHDTERSVDRRAVPPLRCHPALGPVGCIRPIIMPSPAMIPPPSSPALLPTVPSQARSQMSDVLPLPLCATPTPIPTPTPTPVPTPSAGNNDEGSEAANHARGGGGPVDGNPELYSFRFQVFSSDLPTMPYVHRRACGIWIKGSRCPPLAWYGTIRHTYNIPPPRPL